MPHPKDIIKQAITLRSKGRTYREIQRVLKIKIPKSTLSSWCTDIELPKWYHDKVKSLNNQNLSKAQKMAWVVNKRKQEELRENLMKRNQYLAEKTQDKDILKMLLAMLYLGEGAKWKSHRGLHLGSSDPNIIRLYMKLLDACYDIKVGKFRGSICYRADQNLGSLQKYWSGITGIPLRDFYPTKPDSRTVGKITKQKNYKGVCALTCAGTNIQLELEAIPKIILTGV